MSFSPRKKKKPAVPIDQGTGAHVGSTFDRLDGRITIKANLVSKDMSVGNSVTAKIVTGNSPGERFSEKDVRIPAAPTESMIKHFQKMEEDIVMGAERLLAKTKSKKPRTTTTSKNDGPGLCATSMRETNLSDSELEALVECVPGLLSVKAPNHWNAKVAVASTDQQDGLCKIAVAGVNQLSEMALQKGVAQIEMCVSNATLSCRSHWLFW